jgi:hypothetical protein
MIALRLILVSILVVLLSAPAQAADKSDKKAADSSGQFIDVSPVAAPIVLHGQLINYVFITLRLDLSPRADAIRLRDKEPYFRDALVRAAHRRPFVKPGDYTHLDETALKAVMIAESARIVGPGVVTGVEIRSAQPKRVTGLPRDSAPLEHAPIP